MIDTQLLYDMIDTQLLYDMIDTQISTFSVLFANKTDWQKRYNIYLYQMI